MTRHRPAWRRVIHVCSCVHKRCGILERPPRATSAMPAWQLAAAAAAAARQAQ